MRQRVHCLSGARRELATDEVSLARAVLQETPHPDLGVFSSEHFGKRLTLNCETIIESEREAPVDRLFGESLGDERALSET